MIFKRYFDEMRIKERQTEKSWILGVITPKLKIHYAGIIVIQSGV